MDWITENIAIGNYVEAEDGDLLRKGSIRSILGLIRTLQGKEPADLGLTRIEVVPLVDGPGNDSRLFQCAVAALTELVQTAPPVLVHCQAGRSRSIVVVAGYLMKSLGIDVDEALARVSAKREGYVSPDMKSLLDGLT
jgi:protein-tyrosine phosphatase